ncbi:MAG TPA: helix-turn-helix domain-containing protein [Candidatus Udaeobacter sp.]|nr:helix-turn-helix domain-containing protein [Candidatus Udaeobacter sp.]
MKTKSNPAILPVPKLSNLDRSAIINVKKDIEQTVKEEIGAKIKKIRRNSRGFLTAEVVAHKLGVSRVALTQLENGQNHVNAVTLWKLATILGCEVKDFFPDIPKGYELSQIDVENIKKKDENAAEWAEKIFGKVNK